MNETPATVRMIDGATAPVISNVFVNNACAVCTLQITGSFTAATVLVEGIVNVASNQWVTLAAFNLSDLSLEKDGADKAGIYQVGIEGILRVRMNVTEISGGDITIAAQFGNATINQFSETEASNLIPITAYDLAVAGGYTGTLEQFETDMGNSASNATAAANSANDAALSASEASASATASEAAATNMAPVYSASSTYAVGDYVLYNGGLFRCTTAITTAEAWTASHWTTVKMGPEVSDLKTQITYVTGNAPISLTEQTVVVNNGNTTSLEQVTQINNNSAIIPCNEGDKFTLTGEGSFNYRLWAFCGAKDGDTYPVLTPKADANAVGVNLVLTAPANAKYLTVNFKRNYTTYPGIIVSGDTVKQRLDEISPIVQKTEDTATSLVISEYMRIKKNPSSTETDKVYSTLATTGTALEGYQTDAFSVSAGEQYDITILNLPSGYQYKVALFYDSNGNYIGYKERDPNSNAQRHIYTVIPDGAALMRISHSITATLIVNKYAPNNNSNKKTVSLDNGMITIQDNDFVFKMSKHGKNNLMDFYSVSDKNYNLIYQATSDWQGPYEVSAVDNADGDAISDGVTFTGGNHAYSYDGTTGTATARTSEFHVYADGVELSDGDMLSWIDNVEVSWTNYVQGWNTKKSDGTGREIVKEMPKWVFTPGGKINVSNTIVALEDILIYMYYGLQMQSAWMDEGVFIPSVKRDLCDMSIFTPTAQGGAGTRFYGYETIGYDSNVNIKMGFNPLIDMGDGNAINNNEIKETRIHATASAGKLYMYMIYDYTVDEDGQLIYNGYYNFERP